MSAWSPMILVDTRPGRGHRRVRCDDRAAAAVAGHRSGYYAARGAGLTRATRGRRAWAAGPGACPSGAPLASRCDPPSIRPGGSATRIGTGGTPTSRAGPAAPRAGSMVMRRVSSACPIGWAVVSWLGLLLRARGGRARHRGRGGRRHLQAAGQRGRSALVLRRAAARPAGRSGLRQRDGDRRGRPPAVQHPLAAVPAGCRAAGRRCGTRRTSASASRARWRPPVRAGCSSRSTPPPSRPARSTGGATRTCSAFDASHPDRPPAALRPALGGDAALHRPLLPGARRRCPARGRARPEHRRGDQRPALGLPPRRRRRPRARARSASRSAPATPRSRSGTGPRTSWRSATSSSRTRRGGPTRRRSPARRGTTSSAACSTPMPPDLGAGRLRRADRGRQRRGDRRAHHRTWTCGSTRAGSPISST